MQMAWEKQIETALPHGKDLIILHIKKSLVVGFGHGWATGRFDKTVHSLNVSSHSNLIVHLKPFFCIKLLWASQIEKGTVLILSDTCVELG